jgi:adenylate kinase
MDRAEKLQFQQGIENYFEEKRVYDLFEKLLKELIINKPQDPIDYLIKRIKTKDIKRIFITGSAGADRKEISLSLAEFFNYSCISVGDLIQKEISKKLESGRKIEKKMESLNLVDDETIIELLKKEIVKLEKDNVSYIVEGFPRTRVSNFIK